jgi:dTDP-4-amino-4,6-dideoxygalactose transaminase
VDKYTWVDIGSSFLPAEIVAAFLWGQLEQADLITRRRLDLWQRYHDGFASLEREGRLRRPIVPEECGFNAHMYYLLLRDLDERTRFIDHMKRLGIQCVFHYVPLHSSPTGRQVGRASGALSVTEDIADRLVRMPLWPGLEEQVDTVVDAVVRFFEQAD